MRLRMRILYGVYKSLFEKKNQIKLSFQVFVGWCPKPFDAECFPPCFSWQLGCDLVYLASALLIEYHF